MRLIGAMCLATALTGCFGGGSGEDATGAITGNGGSGTGGHTSPEAGGGGGAHPGTGGSGGDGAHPGTDGGTDCVVTTLFDEGFGTPSEETTVYTFDEAARRLTTLVYVYDLDEQDRVVKVYGTDPGGPTLYWTNYFDEYGNLSSVVHYTLGTTTYDNTYENGLLVSVKRTGGGFDSTETLFRYEDESMPAAWTSQGSEGADGGAFVPSLTRTFLDGRVHELSLLEEPDVVTKKYTYTYENGRVSMVERDGGYWSFDVPDGTPDIRYTWERDAAGVVTRFVQDGTDSFDNPFVEGKPDYAQSYAPACEALLTRFAWLAHEPGPDSVGPRFRTDRH